VPLPPLGIPGSGALLGALAIVFQGLLRDFAAGLVELFDDRYAIGDSVDLGGFSGLVDLGVLSTELRGADSRVMTVPNSGCEPVSNHTKLCSGAELRLPLASGGLDLPHVLEVVRQEVTAFAAVSDWQPSLLQPPQLRGVSEVTVDAVWLSVLLTTLAGRHNAARRELLARLVERLGRSPWCAPPLYPLASGELRISRSLFPKEDTQGMALKGLRQWMTPKGLRQWLSRVGP
jgi:small conductance mechanosensitive channel